ncbi:aldolase/citrate lyase family protein [Blastopirellula sp. J2-11]|uniref:HpcH/HpaI aldolase family protein n=1 Tax=Blastopirellula sp. J2-11 TaxID=2943192 RepID=UPI0021C8A749|nr:aldolase/citrate lyase family protein [Blastopirellula sp. J2-11]UUO07169.1 aldolase/citrate lyase family protein [Blastopirellula sp. J2-11]
MTFRLIFVIALLLGGNTGNLRAQSAAKNPLRLNRFIELMEAKTPAFGMFSQNINARTGAAIADSSLDFVIIDMEHSPYDVTRLENYLLGMINKRKILQKGNLQPNVVPFVRIPAAGREPVDHLLKQVLDAGVLGVIVPHVDTAEQALAIVKACRFPQKRMAEDYQPEGKRGVGYRHAARYWGLTPQEYAQRADVWPLDPQGELVVWVMIETVEAVQNCEDIAQTPGVGGLFIGPSDLAFSLGVDKGDPVFEAAIAQVASIAQKNRIPCGLLSNGDQIQQRLKQGFQFIAVGLDGGLPVDVHQALEKARKSSIE